jgi:type VI secretion system Hcp family effector
VRGKGSRELGIMNYELHRVFACLAPLRETITLLGKHQLMRKTNVAAVLATVLLLWATHLSAQKVYMKVELAKGVVRDQGMPAKFQDRIELAGYQFETSAGSSGNSKLPLTITKNYGQSTVQLFKAYSNKDVIKSVVIEVYKFTNAGTEVLDQTITLSNARITSFRQNFDNTPPPGVAKGPIDEFRFSYQKMSIAYVSSNVSWEDD